MTKGPVAVDHRIAFAVVRGLQARLEGSVWTTCRSWYRMDSGKVVALFPGFTREYERAIEKPDPADYEFA